MAGFASAVGLLLGGVLTDADLFGWGWRSVFLVNVPVALAAGLVVVRCPPGWRAGLPGSSRRPSSSVGPWARRWSARCSSGGSPRGPGARMR
ncbi:hypothetical protein [Streptomyces sp. NPDC086023]|uniref:hypothetical protein n=1 Tax=Streptomyces sp. NPDC086023 TaxID=3365746 RepID=UPI0037D5B163